MIKLIDIIGKLSALIAFTAIPFTCAGFLDTHQGIAVIITGMLVCCFCEAGILIEGRGCIN